MPTEVKEVWYINSGCSRHMTGNIRTLKNYKEYKGPKVVFGDSSKGSAKGKGTLVRGNIEIHDVLYVEG